MNKKNQSAQKALQKIFQGLLEQADDPVRVLLSDAQKNWILYRDAQCRWEAHIPETQALERLYELSCLAQMTEQRISELEAVREIGQQASPREFSAQPRWMNALADDYPHIFWRYGAEKVIDINCDGQDEKIMSGISVTQMPAKIESVDQEQEAELLQHEVEIVIAVSENPETGRPKADLLRVPVSTHMLDEPRFCRSAVTLEVLDVSPHSVEEAEKKPFCKNAVQLADQVCPPLLLQWDGKNYVFGGMP